MNITSQNSAAKRRWLTLFGGVACVALAVTGCTKQPAASPTVSAEPPVPTPAPQVVAQPEVVVADDYVYYPEYEIYFSNRRHEYGYWEGGAWLWRPAPPRIGVNVLLSSPSVHMDFHDSPERHHPDVVRRYPHSWKPSRDGHDDRKR